MAPKWSYETLIRYTLLQIPSLALLIVVLLIARNYIDISWWTISGIILLWVLKDAALFPLLWRAYDKSKWGTAGLMVGKQGVATQPLNPRGYIRIHGELWKAEVMEGSISVQKGDAVRVEERRGLVLRVRPE